MYLYLELFFSSNFCYFILSLYYVSEVNMVFLLPYNFVGAIVTCYNCNITYITKNQKLTIFNNYYFYL